MSKLLVILTLLTITSCGVSDMCDNEVIKEVYSPDKEFKAVIFSRDCGATTGTSRQLSIIKANKELKNERGNTFIIDEGETRGENALQIKIEWNNSKQLTVYFDSLARTFEMKDKIEEIEIKYKNL